MKLSKAYIEAIKTWDLKKIDKTEFNREPYQVPFYPHMVGAHLLIGWPAGDILE
jgi:hypothetical protein